MQEFSPQAILLDFYGTVVEEDDIFIERICQKISQASAQNPTVSEVGSYWSRLFREMCTESFDDSFQLQTELERNSLDKVLNYYQADLDSDELSQILIDYWAKPTIFPESKAVLSQCKIPICLVSNIDNVELHSALNHNGLTFEWIVTSEDCKSYKPREEMFEKALHFLGLERTRVLHIGDSLGSDVKGAKSFGIPVLWINRKNREAPSSNMPDYSAPDLTGLIDFLQV